MKINIKLLIIGIAISVLLTLILPGKISFLFLPFIGAFSFSNNRNKDEEDDDEKKWHI